MGIFLFLDNSVQDIYYMVKVYLLECDHRYKIGYTRNSIDKRIKQMKTGNHQDLKVIASFESKWGTKIEAHLHNRFKNKKLDSN